jgi:hypothetical protein
MLVAPYKKVNHVVSGFADDSISSPTTLLPDSIKQANGQASKLCRKSVLI